jgi:arabinofuranosyltransferase
VLHTISGMETALFALILTWFLYLVTRFVDRPSGQSAAPLAFAGLLLGLTRPEGNLVSLIGLASALAIIPKPRRCYLAKTVLLVYILPGAAYFVWRALYYGHLFPLPFYLKVLSGGFLAGLYDVASFGVYMVAHVGVLILLGAQKMSSRLLPALLAVIAFLIFFMFPEHVMGYQWRFLFPAVPFFLVVTTLGIAILLDWMHKLGGKYSYWSLFLLVSGVMVSIGMLVDTQEVINWGKSYWASLSAAHIPLGKRLSQCSFDGSHLLAIGDAGAVPYYSGWQTLDTYGLNDSHIAISNVHDPAYLLSQGPDLLILISSSEDDFYPKLPWELTFYEQGLRAGLSRIEIVKYADDYYLWVMGNPDSLATRCLLK